MYFEDCEYPFCFVCVCGYQKYIWYWPPTLKCPALGKRSRQRYCVQTLSSSSRLIADDSQDLPVNTRVLCVYTCVTYLSILITSSQVVGKKKQRQKQSFSSIFLLLTNSAFFILMEWMHLIQEMQQKQIHKYLHKEKTCADMICIWNYPDVPMLVQVWRCNNCNIHKKEAIINIIKITDDNWNLC